MFWSYGLPFQITFWILFTLYIVAIVVARRYQKMGKVAIYGAAIAFLIFIPCCTGIKAIMDPFRFGVFEYANHAAIRQYPVRTNLPEAATAITVDQQWGLFCAKFSIEQEALDKWFEEQWKLHGATSRTPREAVATVTKSDLDFHNDLVAGKWSVPPTAVIYKGPRRGDFRGFVVLYDVPKKTAYEFMFYW
ncbi:MAG: hypothetical protein IT366_08290 [Candidatus Hydrogenedentes bacterium]|nr:hypothetical protein [Candidatus Hydrogenedentota bacterium]